MEIGLLIDCLFKPSDKGIMGPTIIEILSWRSVTICFFLLQIRSLSTEVKWNSRRRKKLSSREDFADTVNVIPNLVQLNHLKIHLYNKLFKYMLSQSVFSIQLLSFAWSDDIFNYLHWLLIDSTKIAIKNFLSCFDLSE
jgi:hypothetical protein